jgi:hypothetical protein
MTIAIGVKVRWNRNVGFHLAQESVGTIVAERFDNLYKRMFYTVKWANGLRSTEDCQNLVGTDRRCRSSSIRRRGDSTARRRSSGAKSAGRSR